MSAARTCARHSVNKRGSTRKEVLSFPERSRKFWSAEFWTKARTAAARSAARLQRRKGLCAELALTFDDCAGSVARMTGSDHKSVRQAGGGVGAECDRTSLCSMENAFC